MNPSRRPSLVVGKYNETIMESIYGVRLQNKDSDDMVET